MSLFDKLRTAGGAPFPQQRVAAPRGQVATAVTAKPMNPMKTGPSSSTVACTSRLSNGLKEFLSQLNGIGRGQLLDMGPARQTTLNFFIERGFKVYTEDLLATWQYFLEEQAQQLKQLAADGDRSEFSVEGRAEKFLKTTMQFPDDTFDAIL